jgi:hypothetical protein
MRQVYFGASEGQSEGTGFRPIPEPWPVPVTMGLTTREVDRKTGKLWTDACMRPDSVTRYTEIYLPGTEPTQFCDDTGPIRNPLIRVRPLPPRVPPPVP